MNGQTAIVKLRALEPELRKLGVAALYQFGSVARGEATGKSDIDLFFDKQAGSRLSLLDVIGIRHFLEDRLEAPVDLILRDGLHSLLRADIAAEAEAVAVF